MALTGNEILYVQGVAANDMPAAIEFPTTTGAIAALSSAAFGSDIITSIATAGNGTLTAAGMVGGVINRTGPTAVYTDTTATAAQIYSQLGSVTGSFYLIIRNTVPFTQTLTNGSGVTITGTVIPANSVATYLVSQTSAVATTMVQLEVVRLSSANLEVITTLSTVGAATITAAGIVGGVTSRTGSQSGTPFTDTTATADLIIAARSNASIGTSWEYTYQNTTNAVATLTGGVGVTVSGITAVNAGYSARYLITYTAASTITIVGFAGGLSLASTQQNATFAGSTSGTTIVKASAIAGSTTQTLPAVTGVVASTSGANLYIADITKCTSSLTKNTSAAYSNITGLTQTVVPGTYQFVCRLPSTVANGTGGIKYAFNYTTTVLTSIEATGRGFAAAAVAVQHTTTTTTQTDLFSQAAVVLFTEITGTMVVATGGTIDLQMAQNTSNASDTITLLGASMEFVRIV